MWKRASPHKIEDIRRGIKKMKFKDDEEKKQYMKMWEEELFKVRISKNRRSLSSCGESATGSVCYNKYAGT